MQQGELQRLMKIEDIIMRYAEEYGLQTVDIEWDVIPDQKMLEIMAYHLPTNISNWKYGRDYERMRTMQENAAVGLPLEVVINSDPIRAYLMKSNPFAMQAMVMSHVIGHAAFFTMNEYYVPTRKDIVSIMKRASDRFNEYERKYGMDEVEYIVDAGHALQLHSSPFDNETEDERRQKKYEMMKKNVHTPMAKSEFRDLLGNGAQNKVLEDVELYNQKLLRKLRRTTPVEPMMDLLRYIIDNSKILEDWHKDILEVLRLEGRYLWPMIQTKYMNEGFATYWHQIIMERLFDEGHLTDQEHAQYNYSNSLVRAKNPFGMNPYLIGCEMWKNIEERWNKGQHGPEWRNCTDIQLKKDWDTGEMKGREKIMEVMRTHTDWFFMQEFLTPELIVDLDLYVYVQTEDQQNELLVITKHQAEEIRDLIVKTFSHSRIPMVKVMDGNYNGSGEIYLKHFHAGADLAIKDAQETMKHIWRLWGSKVYLEAVINGAKTVWVCSNKNDAPRPVAATGPSI